MEEGDFMQNAGQTEVIRTEKGQFPPGMSGNPDKIITKENQPTGAAKSKGKQLKKASREALRDILNLKYTFSDPKAKEELENAFGKRAVKNANAYEIAAMKQLLVSIRKSNSQAFTGLSNQAFGLPKQALEHTGAGGGPIATAQTVITQVIVENPHLKKDAE